MENKDAIIDRLTRQVETLLARISELEDEVARLKKDSNNSSKPPSSDIVKPKKATKRKCVKRKRGGQPGHKKHSRKPFTPDEIDHSFEYDLLGNDSKGLVPLNPLLIDSLDDILLLNGDSRK